MLLKPIIATNHQNNNQEKYIGLGSTHNQENSGGPNLYQLGCLFGAGFLWYMEFIPPFLFVDSDVKKETLTKNYELNAGVHHH